MNVEALRQIGLTENEIKIYLDLLTAGSSTAYEIGKRTGILMDKGLVTHIYKGAKKHFQATKPAKLQQYIEDKKKQIELQEEAVNALLPQLEAMHNLPKEDTFVEVFKGKEGLKYFLKDIVKTAKDVSITGIDDEKYEEAIPIFMKQYFRDLRKNNIQERVITVKKEGVFLFDYETAPTTHYRYLEATQFNPTNTFVYGNKVVIVTWGSPITAVMIKNKFIAETYRNHFEHLWKVAEHTN